MYTNKEHYWQFQEYLVTAKYIRWIKVHFQTQGSSAKLFIRLICLSYIRALQQNYLQRLLDPKRDRQRDDLVELTILTTLFYGLKTEALFWIIKINPKLSKLYIKGHFRAFFILLTSEIDTVDLKGHLRTTRASGHHMIGVMGVDKHSWSRTGSTPFQGRMETVHRQGGSPFFHTFSTPHSSPEVRRWMACPSTSPR